MSNPWRKCQNCGLNHRPGNCRKGGVLPYAPISMGVVAPEGASSPSRVILTVDLTPLTARLDAIEKNLAELVGKLPGVTTEREELSDER